jgi:hypothetical protein
VAIHSESDFYEPLSPYGRWEVVGSYGRCWMPGGVDADWSPYANGHWEQSDGGWYWASDEPWGWATYHYGGWDYDSHFGWYWVPQTEWAPAWVSWREGGGYVGWSPMRPATRFWGSRVASRGAIFVEENHFLEPVSRKTIIVNTTIVSKTEINKKGPDTAVIERASGRKLQAVPVRELRTKEEAKAIARRPTPISTGEKTVQPTVRSQVEPAEKKVAPVLEPRQVEKPAVKTDESRPPSTEKAEGKPETKVEPKRETERPEATREPREQKDGKDGDKKD